MIVAFSGKARVGKTEAAKAMESIGYERQSFAKKLKKIARQLFNVTKKEPGGRKILQALGIKLREIDPNVWVNYLFRTYTSCQRVTIDDCRFKNEFDRVRGLGGIVVQVIKDIPANYPGCHHISEHDLDDAEFDLVLYNNCETKALWHKKVIEAVVPLVESRR